MAPDDITNYFVMDCYNDNFK